MGMIGYFDLPSGLSGDMTLGCLLDAGWPIEELRAMLGRLSLPTEEYSLDARVVRRGAFRATLADVKVLQLCRRAIWRTFAGYWIGRICPPRSRMARGAFFPGLPRPRPGCMDHGGGGAFS